MTETISLDPFTPAHLAGALRLSQAENWPHRAEDWALTLSVSQGVVALLEGEIVGTALCSEFGDVAMLNMIIVDRKMRGRGLGRRLMEAVMARAGGREMRLVATHEGLPLYEKLGFVRSGKIEQYQGIAHAVTAEAAVSHLARPDLVSIAAADFAASGLDRAALLAALSEQGVILSAGSGFAALRSFGRGAVLGPIVAQDASSARALIADAARRMAGSFLRIDLPAERGLGPFVTRLGLAHVGGGTAMVRNPIPRPPAAFQTYALISQALG